MEFLGLLFLLIALAALISLLTGLFKPWIVLWWEDVQNRKKVIRLYGSILLTALIFFWLTELFIRNIL